MIFVQEPIWEPCSKEEFDRAMKDFPAFHTPYRRVPIYRNGGGILDQIQLYGKEPDGYRYEKCVGRKDVAILSSDEIEDEKLMKILGQ